MADLADLAEMREQQERDIALNEARRQAGPAFTGACLHCGEPLAARRWCNAFCRDEWDRRYAARVRNA